MPVASLAADPVAEAALHGGAPHPKVVLPEALFGTERVNSAGYDLASVFARTGISHEMTTQGEPPAPLMQGLGDTFTAMTGVAGILAALHERQQTGRGAMVDVSLLRTGMWALAGELGVAAMGGDAGVHVPVEHGEHSPGGIAVQLPQ